MKKMYFLLVAFALGSLSLALSSCSDDDSPPLPGSESVEITVDPATIADFPVDASSQTIAVTTKPANVEWKAVVIEDWAYVNKSDDSFTLIVGRNPGEERTGSITLSAENATPVVIEFKQVAAPIENSLEISGTFEYTAATGAKALTIKSNTAWTVTTTYNEGTGWLSYSVASGTGNATVNVTAAQNTGAARTAQIKVQATADAALYKTVNVSQAAPAPASAFIDELVGAWTHKGYLLKYNSATKEWTPSDNTHEITITKIDATSIKIDNIILQQVGSAFHNAITATVNSANKTVTIARQVFSGGTGSWDEDEWDVYFTPYTKELTEGYHELWGESFTNIPVTGVSGSYSIDLRSSFEFGQINGAAVYTSYLPLTIVPGAQPSAENIYWYSLVVADAVFVQGAPPASAPSMQKAAKKVVVNPSFEKMIQGQRAK